MFLFVGAPLLNSVDTKFQSTFHVQFLSQAPLPAPNLLLKNLFVKRQKQADRKQELQGWLGIANYILNVNLS